MANRNDIVTLTCSFAGAFDGTKLRLLDGGYDVDPDGADDIIDGWRNEGAGSTVRFANEAEAIAHPPAPGYWMWAGTADVWAPYRPPSAVQSVEFEGDWRPATKEEASMLRELVYWPDAAPSGVDFAQDVAEPDHSTKAA